jgi:hypothetical protein
MARTLRAALAEAAELDTERWSEVIGDGGPTHLVANPEAPDAPALPGQLNGEWLGMARRIAISASVSIDDAEEAIGASLLKLWETRRALFDDPPESWQGLLYSYAERRARTGAYDTRTRKTCSIEQLRGESEELFELATSPAIAYTKAGVNEAARKLAPPRKGRRWSREQIIGAVQRFRDRHGRAPLEGEFKPANKLPSVYSVKQAGFEHMHDLLIEAGVPVETRMHRRPWSAEEAAEECARFLHREGHWPSHFECKRMPTGSFPEARVLERYFGGCSMAAVQAGVERILGGRSPRSLPKWVPIQERRRRQQAAALVPVSSATTIAA